MPIKKNKKINNKKNKKHEIVSIFFLILLGLFSSMLFWSYKIISDYNFDAINQFSPLHINDFPVTKYIDQESKYSLLYPQNWQTQGQTDKTVIKEYKLEQDQLQPGSAQIIVKTYPRENLSLIEWLQKTTQKNKLFLIKEDQAININGIPAMKLNLKEDENNNSMTVYLPQNDLVYEIKLIYPSNASFYQYQKIFKKIISSFKFLN